MKQFFFHLTSFQGSIKQNESISEFCAFKFEK